MDNLKDLLAAGQTRAAREEATKRLAKNPDDLPAMIALTKAHLVEGELPEAEALLQKAEAKGGITPDTLVCRATLAAEREDAATARSCFEQATKASPPQAEAFYGYGIVLAATGDLQGSLKAFQRAVELAPRAGILHYHLAQNLLSLEQPEPAVEHLVEAIKYNPLYPPAYVVFSRILATLDRYEDARNVLKEGLKHLPNNPMMMSALTNLELVGGSPGGAFKTAIELAQAQPDDPGAQSNLAVLLLAQERYDEAMKICSRMAAKGLSNVPLKMVEATVLEARKPPDFAGAAKAYEEAMAMDPEDWTPANNLGQMLLRRKEGDLFVSRAITLFEEALRRSPGQLEPMLNLALAYVRSGQKDKGKELAKQLLKYKLPDNNPLREQAQRLIKMLGG